MSAGRGGLAGLGLVLLGACRDSPAGPPGVTVRELDHMGARWTVATVDLERASLRLVGQSKAAPAPHTLQNISDWLVATTGSAPVVAMNAGIYMEDRRPLGLHVEEGQAYRGVNHAEGYGNFYLMPNGIFSVGPAGAAITATTDWGDRAVDQLLLATQSGPLLVDDGVLHPRLMPGSPNLKRRNGVGVRDAQTVVLATSVDRVRFHDMATLFRDVLGCGDALYLDGTVSAMRTPAQPAVEGDPLGYSGILVVQPREAVPRWTPSAPAAPAAPAAAAASAASAASGASAAEAPAAPDETVPSVPAPPPKTTAAAAPEEAAAAD